MIRLVLTNVIDFLTDNLRCIVLMLVLLWLVTIAISGVQAVGSIENMRTQDRGEILP